MSRWAEFTGERLRQIVIIYFVAHESRFGVENCATSSTHVFVNVSKVNVLLEGVLVRKGRCTMFTEKIFPIFD
jgi:hypothetical protein